MRLPAAAGRACRPVVVVNRRIQVSINPDFPSFPSILAERKETQTSTCVCPFPGDSSQWEVRIADFGLHCQVDAVDRAESVKQLWAPQASFQAPCHWTETLLSSSHAVWLLPASFGAVAEGLTGRHHSEAPASELQESHDQVIQAGSASKIDIDLGEVLTVSEI